DYSVDARQQDGTCRARNRSIYLVDERPAGRGCAWNGAGRRAGGTLGRVDAVYCSHRSGMDRRWGSLSFFAPLGGEPLVHAAATGVERTRQPLTQLLEKLVVRLEL